MKIKETDITSSFANVISFIKDQVRENIITAHRKSLVRDLNENQINQLCNIVDSSVDQAATKAIGSEARGLMRRIEDEIKTK